MPATRQITSNFGRTVEKDLTTREKEFELKMFPLNIILDFGGAELAERLLCLP